MESHFLIFVFDVCALGVISKTFAGTDVKESFSRSFTVSGLTFKSLIQLS